MIAQIYRKLLRSGGAELSHGHMWRMMVEVALNRVPEFHAYQFKQRFGLF
jgi:hypothetical protein